MQICSTYCWKWLKELTRGKEQVFNKTTRSLSSDTEKNNEKSKRLIWNLSDLIFVTACFQFDIIYLCNMSYMFKNNERILSFINYYYHYCYYYYK